MAVFFEQVEVVNRTSKPLEIRYDGQRHVIEPNYTEDGKRIPGVHNMIPTVVVYYALNQTVLMGSEDIINPTRFRSLIGVIDRRPKKESGKELKQKSWHDTSFLSQAEVTEHVTRVPISALMEEDITIKDVKIKTTRRADDARLEDDVPTPFDLRAK